ncbi:MAG TPA: class I SAM-dependent rRNA methyltransferase [Candidatus Eisenbacteria bacterium]|nr:class I SAM-dependent rRNA methyltransferase [Candidatus Eisenbacteria bacterium]
MAEILKSAVRLAKNQERRLRSGHPWVFSNEIDSLEEGLEAGDEVVVLDHRGQPIGVGLYNPHSLIAVRLYARHVRPIDANLFRDRIDQALALRRRILPVEVTYRLVHGEGDYLPGLVVDRYGEILCVQSLSAGIERRIDSILDVLEELLRPRGILCRRDSQARSLEGLPLLEPIERGEVPERVEVPYEGLMLTSDLRHGQKTGEFLDQRENRKRVAREAHGRRVLDLYCYTGLFSLHCCMAGAASVLGIDSSAPAIERARANAERNAPGRDVQFRVEEVERALEGFGREEARFDMIILDPPALVRSRKALAEGARKYVAINSAALQLLKPGGTIATATCSHHVDQEAFLEILRAAAKHARTELRLVRVLGQSRDHPILLSARETSYLTLVIAERIR